MTTRLLVVHYGDEPRLVTGVLHGTAIAAVTMVVWGLTRFPAVPLAVNVLAAPAAIWLAGNLVRKISREAKVSLGPAGIVVERFSTRRFYPYCEIEACSLSRLGVLDVILSDGYRIALEPPPFLGSQRRRFIIEQVTRNLKSHIEAERSQQRPGESEQADGTSAPSD